MRLLLSPYDAPCITCPRRLDELQTHRVDYGKVATPGRLVGELLSESPSEALHLSQSTGTRVLRVTTEPAYV